MFFTSRTLSIHCPYTVYTVYLYHVESLRDPGSDLERKCTRNRILHFHCHFATLFSSTIPFSSLFHVVHGNFQQKIPSMTSHAKDFAATDLSNFPIARSFSSALVLVFFNENREHTFSIHKELTFPLGLPNAQQQHQHQQHERR
jgi:hypothetical protein